MACKPAVAALLILAATPAVAYELHTHAAVTRRAAAASPGLAAYLADVGITATDTFDKYAATLPAHLAGLVNTGTAVDWLVEGAVREDDYQPHTLMTWAGCPPPANPPAPMDRPLHHFYDVQRGGAGLTLPGVTGLPAPAWALGLQGRGPGPTQNQWTWLDARAAQVRALTDAAPGSRAQQTARLFRALGQVAHLLQDLGQPDHVRNDPHPDCIGETSWYEGYVETRADGRGFRRRGVPAPPLVYDGSAVAPVAPLTLFDDMAGFTSRSWFSADTNLPGCAGLPLPPCTPGAYTRQTQPFAVTVGPVTVAGTVTLLLRGTVPVSAWSVWDQHLEARGRDPVYTLNTFVYDAMADRLIPRAVAASAALLDRFFRGRLDLTVTGFFDTRTPARTLDLHVAGAGLGPGTVAVYYDRPDGTRVPVGAWPFPLTAPIPLPGLQADQAAPARYLVVYRGAVDGEADVVAARWLDAAITYLDLQRIDHLGQDQALAYGFDAEVYAAPDYYAVEVGTNRERTHQGEIDRAIHAYRPPGWPGGDQATAVLFGHCSDDAGGLPVTAELVAGAGPYDVATLLAHRWDAPPPVARVLLAFTLAFGTEAEVAIPVDLTGVRLVGVRLVSQPTPAGEWAHHCWAGASLRVPR